MAFEALGSHGIEHGIHGTITDLRYNYLYKYLLEGATNSVGLWPSIRSAPEFNSMGGEILCCIPTGSSTYTRTCYSLSL